MLAVASEDLDTVDALLERIGPEEADYENNVSKQKCPF